MDLKAGSIILNFSPQGTLFFANPLSTIKATTLGEIPYAFKEIALLLKRGFYLAGFISYEAGFYFETDLVPKPSNLPLLCFWAYKHPLESLYKPIADYKISNIRFQPNLEDYYQAIDKIKQYIRSGDVYQINFTGRLYFDFEGCHYSLLSNLTKHHPMPYSAFISLSDDESVVCLSPELFFKVQGRQIISKPMKGTIRRGKDTQEDAKLASYLLSDPKNRAENLMIVDLIRNDFGKVCEVGSIEVTSLFEIEKYDSLFQMTSTVVGTLKNGIHLQDILRAIFPGGSITGAPKIRAMQIIHELEDTARGIYTGSIGVIHPNGDCVFNIAIRTIYLKGTEAVMGVGSGIVWDSDALKEYNECLLKAEFLKKAY